MRFTFSVHGFAAVALLALSACVSSPKGGNGRRPDEGGTEARPDLAGVDYLVRFTSFKEMKDGGSQDSPVADLTKGRCFLNGTGDALRRIRFTVDFGPDATDDVSSGLRIESDSETVPTAGYSESFGGEPAEIVVEKTANVERTIPNKSVLLWRDGGNKSYISLRSDNPSRCQLDVLDFEPLTDERHSELYSARMRMILNCAPLVEQAPNWGASSVSFGAEIRCLVNKN